MSNISYGQEGWTTLYGIKTSNSISFHSVVKLFNSKCGPSNCETCRYDGTFEGVFYSLCAKCCATEPCSCVYCRVANKDGHKHIERRTNIGKFVQELQTVVNDLRRDYPTDEFGMVQEGIDAGFYILNLHTAKQYELLLLDTVLPSEVSQLSNGELIYQWNPLMTVPNTVIQAALTAAKRTGILEWVHELWGMSEKEKEQFTIDDQNVLATFEEKLRYIQPLCNYSLPKKEDEDEDEDVEDFIRKCDCGHLLTTDEGDLCHTCLEIYLQNAADYETQCLECDTWVTFKETDKRGYCLDCQNPEYDPVWPMGD